jgi:subtilisin family serine protease
MEFQILRYFLTLIVSYAFCFSANGQLPDTARLPENWHLLDPQKDRYQGISAEKAYAEFLHNRPSRTVTVAIIDSGIDIEHEDLKDAIWTNEDELPGNGVDDDKNGYVDDVHGWNFIGGKDGNVKEDTDELTREYVRLKEKFESVPENKISRREKDEFDRYQKVKSQLESLREKSIDQYRFYKSIFSNLKFSADTIKAILKTDRLTRRQIEEFTTNDPTLTFSRGIILQILENVNTGGDVDDLLSDLQKTVEHFESTVKYGYNEDFDPRHIVGDHYEDSYEKYYGNNDVKGPFSEHGTHVAGIVGAVRDNNLGVNGIAGNVRLMAVRAVPNGDERDKDVANAIYYAVDNGAQVINMSFGKSISPQKEAVDKAVKYAEQRGVLIVHAAGNDGDNIETKKDFPTRYFLDGQEARNWIEVGASSWGSEDLVAGFSNYGEKSVDLFAPGVEIYSTAPESTYEGLDGTSMASPVVTGVVATLLSYFPELTPFEIKDIVMASTRKFDSLKVVTPGKEERVPLSELSKTGGLINLYEAVKMADKIKKDRLTK